MKITFEGKFTYKDQKAYKEAIDAATETMKFESESIQEVWMASHEIEDLGITVKISTKVDDIEDYYGFETIVEALGEFASEGIVKGWQGKYVEGKEEIYKAQADE